MTHVQKKLLKNKPWRVKRFIAILFLILIFMMILYKPISNALWKTWGIEI